MFNQATQYKLRKSIEGFHRTTRRSIEEILNTDEEVIAALLTKGRWWQVLDRHKPKLILTNRRLIVYNRGVIRHTIEEYPLEDSFRINSRTELSKHHYDPNWAGKALQADPEAINSFIKEVDKLRENLESD